MKPGDIITVYALHADGKWYRRWQTTVESVNDACIVTYSPPNSTVEDFERQLRTLPHALRSYYWFDQPYNLLEVISTDGLLKGIYVNTATRLSFKPCAGRPLRKRVRSQSVGKRKGLSNSNALLLDAV